MPSAESQPERFRPNSEPLDPSPLPPDLADFLRDRPFACVMQASDKGTVFIIKTPDQEIETVRGRVPIALRHQLYAHPAAPVIQTVITIYDQPEHPLALETFTNIEDEQQKADFAALAGQKELYLLFYDELLEHRLSKQVHSSQNEIVSEILMRAEEILAAIPKDKFNFDQAKADIIKRTTI